MRDPIELPCGCLFDPETLTFYFVSHADLDTKNLYACPGKFIPVEGVYGVSF